MNRISFLKTLNLLKNGTSTRNIIEQTDSFIFLEDRILTFNNDVLISIPFKTDIKGAVKSEPLLKYLNKCKSDVLEIIVKDKELIIKDNKSTAGFVLSEINLPFETINHPTEFKSLNEKFIEICNTIKFCAGKDINKFILTTLHITKEFIEACDNFRVIRYKLDMDDEFLIKAEDISNLISSNFKPVEYRVSSEWIHFKDENDVVFSCRKINEKYPDTSKILEFDTEKFSLPSNIYDLIQKSSVFAEDELSGAKIIDLKLTKSEIVVQSKNSNGWFKETAKTRYKGKDILFSVNPTFLNDNVNKFKNVYIGNGRIKFENEDIIYIIALKR